MPNNYPNLPNEDHVVRVVSWSRVVKDEDNNPIGISSEAFALSTNEDGLSVNWLERAHKDPNRQLFETLQLIKNTRKVSTKARLAILNVGNIHSISNNRGKKIRVIHSPIENNEPHSELRQLPENDLILLDQLSTTGVSYHVASGDITS